MQVSTQNLLKTPEVRFNLVLVQKVLWLQVTVFVSSHFPLSLSLPVLDHRVVRLKNFPRGFDSSTAALGHMAVWGCL